MRGKHLSIHPGQSTVPSLTLDTSIISYMIRKDLPLISEINTDNFREIQSMWTSALIAYVDQDDDESRAIFTSFAESHRNEFIYGITTDLTLAKCDAQKFPFIMLYNPLDQVNPIFQESFEISKLEVFTSRYSSPLIGSFSLESYYDYTEVFPLSIPPIFFALTLLTNLSCKVRPSPLTHLYLLPL